MKRVAHKIDGEVWDTACGAVARRVSNTVCKQLSMRPIYLQVRDRIQVPLRAILDL